MLSKVYSSAYTGADMKHTRKNNSDTQVALTVELDGSDLAHVKQKTLKRLAKKIKVAGFRQGKVPTSVAEKNIDSYLLGMELTEDAVNQFALEVLEIEKLQPLERPKVEVTKYVPNQQLEFSATVEVLPKITLGDYKKLNAKKAAVKVTAAEIGEVIERMRQGMAEKKAVKRGAQSGDEVTIDFHGTQDGKDVAGASGKDYPLVLGTSTFIPGFEEGLAGKKNGDVFDLPLLFPKDYHHQPLAGAKVNFAVTVKQVKEVVLPELDDTFAAKCGPFKTVNELKADVKRELTEQKKREALDTLKDVLLEQLVKESKVPTPEVLIADQITSLERDFTQNLLYRGITLEQYLTDQKSTKEEWLAKALRPQAIRRVQVGLALAELSKLENIEVSMEELETRLSQLLQQYGNDASMRSQLDTPETRRDLANRLVTEKTVDRLLTLNQQ